MLIPAKSDTEPKSRAVSPVGQDRDRLMGKQLEAENTNGKSVKPQPKSNYNASANDDKANANGNDDNGDNCAEDEDELRLSDVYRFGSVYEDDEAERREQKTAASKRRIGLQGDQIGTKLKQELNKYKQELKEYNETTKNLEKKYMKINLELSEMQQKNVHFENCCPSESSETEMPTEVDRHQRPLGTHCNSNESITSARTMKRTLGKAVSNNANYLTVLDATEFRSKGRKTMSERVYCQQMVAREHARQALLADSEDQENDSSTLKMYHVLKDVMNTQEEPKLKYPYSDINGELDRLHSTIKSLKSEQQQYRSIIRQQQDRITDYHTRCVKAQEIMKTQKNEIGKLHVNNKQLESTIYKDFEELRSKIDNKLKSVSQLPQLMRDEHTKYEKVLREKCHMVDKLHDLQNEATQLKAKIDELGKRKLVTVSRLKAAERDLKIFKNYNTSLKAEKRRLAAELAVAKQQLDTLQAANKRQLTRQREQTEKQRRELQKRVFDLELKLTRSQNSTTSLIQERDSLIAELQAQLHTLVHNFEVSQKHIRMLRRHIYSMTSTGSNANAGSSNSCVVVSNATPQRSSTSSEQNMTRQRIANRPSRPVTPTVNGLTLRVR